MTAAVPVVRDACPSDWEAFVALWTECLLMHQVPPDLAAAKRIWDLVVDRGSTLGIRVALLAEQVVGFAIHSSQVNSWTGGEDGCLDTLFVASEARGTGVGRVLLLDLLEIGRSRGWRTVFWHVRADNTVARALYDQHGVEEGYVRYRTPALASVKGD